MENEAVMAYLCAVSWKIAGTEKTHENLRQGYWFPTQDSNPYRMTISHTGYWDSFINSLVSICFFVKQFTVAHKRRLDMRSLLLGYDRGKLRQLVN
jgi:hypothetical protein